MTSIVSAVATVLTSLLVGLLKSYLSRSDTMQVAVDKVEFQTRDAIDRKQEAQNEINACAGGIAADVARRLRQQLKDSGAGN
jgi:hypothetical protein